MAILVNPLLIGKRGPEGFSIKEIEAFRRSGICNGYFANPLITDQEVRESMARTEQLANDPTLQALFAALTVSRN